MGAVESDVENQYYEEHLLNINPSTIEFEYWVSIHNIFAEIYTLPAIFQQISPDLASDALTIPIGKSIELSQCEIILKLDKAAQAFIQAENFATNCSKFSLQIMNNAYQAAYFKQNHEKSHETAFMKIGNFATNLFMTTKYDIDKFPFDFEKYKASVLEVIRFLHFIYDFDEHIQNETSYLLILERFEKLMTPNLFESLNSNKQKILSDATSLSRSINFLKLTAPLTHLFVKMASEQGAHQLILYENCISRIVIVCCMTLHKNLTLDIEDTTMLLKAITQGLIILEQIEPLGVFSPQVEQKIPSLVGIQTIGLYINQESGNAELHNQALKLLLSLKTRCKIPKDASEVIQAIFERIIPEELNEVPKKNENMPEIVEKLQENLPENFPEKPLAEIKLEKDFQNPLEKIEEKPVEQKSEPKIEEKPAEQKIEKIIQNEPNNNKEKLSSN